MMTDRERAMEQCLRDMLTNVNQWKGHIDLAVESAKKTLCMHVERRPAPMSEPMPFSNALRLLVQPPNVPTGMRVIAPQQLAESDCSRFPAFSLKNVQLQKWFEVTVFRRGDVVIPEFIKDIQRFAPPSVWLTVPWVVIDFVSYGTEPGTDFFSNMGVQSVPYTQQEEALDEKRFLDEHEDLQDIGNSVLYSPCSSPLRNLGVVGAGL